jgi:hypothetical protein
MNAVAASAEGNAIDPQQKSRLLAGPDYLPTIFLKLQPDIEVIRKLPHYHLKSFGAKLKQIDSIGGYNIRFQRTFDARRRARGNRKGQVNEIQPF